MTSSRAAVISVGTNSSRLLVAQRNGGAWTQTYHEVRGTRLGEGLEAGADLLPAAIERTLAAVADFAVLAKDAQVSYGIGTSALREARNAGEFTRRFADITGTELRILSGDEEARASFTGAAYGLRDHVPADRDICVVDVGGGSTEVAVGLPGADATFVCSAKLGAVRLTESVLKADPPSADELARAAMEARAVLAEPLKAAAKAHALVAVGGTADAAAHMLLAYGGGPAWIAREDLASLLILVAAVPLEQRKQMRGLPPQRADIFPAGLVILKAVMDGVRADSMFVTRADLLLGYLVRATD